MKNRPGTVSAGRLVLTMIVFTCILFVGAVFYSFQNKKDIARKGSGANESLLAGVFEDPSAEQNKDSDGDGLTDWEEVLWSTDPNNADTDGDGVGDKEQVTASDERYALLDSEELSFHVVATNTSLTLTEIASRELFGSYMYSLREGQTLTTEDQNAIATEAVRSIAPLIPRSSFTESELRVVTATQENKVAYVDLVQVIIGNISRVQNEATALFKMAQGNRAEGIQEIEVSVKDYRRYIEELKRVPVPSDALQVHASLIKNFENYVFTLEGFVYFEKDPMRSAVSMNMIQGGLFQVENSFRDLANYIISNGLTKVKTVEQ